MQQAQASTQALAPQFRVDPDWPRAMPYNWQIGQSAGISVDADDNIWVLQRPRAIADSEAGATDAVDGLFVCNAGGNPVEETDDCAPEDAFAEPVAADALGFPRPFGPISDNSIPAPSILKFSPDGELLDAWGGPKWENDPTGNILAHVQKSVQDGGWGWPENLWSGDCQWPANEHGLHIGEDGMLYLAGNGFGDGTLGSALNGEGWDGSLLKFDPETRECLLQIGGPVGEAEAHDDLVDNADTNGAPNGTPRLFRAANMHVKGDELFIADGYGNCRIVVVDKETGLYKRHWGAFGLLPQADTCISEAYAVSDRDRITDDIGEFGEPARENSPDQFRRPVHCVRPSEDGKLYVCDRVNNRIQAFEDLMGTFEQEHYLRADTLGPGAVWDLAFSADRRQSCLHNVDGSNMSLDTLLRETLELLASEGTAGRNAGQFHWVHDVATDSRGNAYITEVDTGKRVQKFDRRGRRGCRSF